jgi:chromosome segregation ATPase
MTANPQSQAIGEILTWLEQQLRESREDQTRAFIEIDQIRRQTQDMAADVDAAERAVREIDPKFVPFHGVPDKINGLAETIERVRQQLVAHQASFDNTVRQLRAEADYDREERAEAGKRVDATASQLGLVMSDVTQVQHQASQVSQTMQTVIERQREVEARVQQLGLRLDRAIEVNRDLDKTIREALINEQEDRFDVVFERLQLIGEMVKRSDDLIREVAAERSLRQEVIDEVAVWREEHARIDGRLNALEGVADRVLSQVDKVQGEITLLEGRHSGLGERVASIRRDIAEIVDHVREEFAKYNQMTEKQRRKQIQVLEQELREMKFHAFKPPEEP